MHKLSAKQECVGKKIGGGNVNFTTSSILVDVFSSVFSLKPGFVFA